jgi:amino acid adenylation domain-containing protein
VEHALLSVNLCRQIQAICARGNISPFVIFLAVLKTLLHRHTGQEDVIVGSPSSDSVCRGADNKDTTFSNLIALRTDLSGDPSFAELLKRVASTIREAAENRDYPFERILEQRQNSTTTLAVQAIFALCESDSPTVSTAPISERDLQELEQYFNTNNLTFLVDKDGDKFTIRCQYDAELFEPKTIIRLLGHYETLLECAVTNPNARLSELALLTDFERRRVLIDWNATEREYPEDKCIHKLVESQVGCTPDCLAVVFEGKRLLYRELNQRANQLAYHLRKLGVGPDVLVGVCVERSLEMVVGLLGILKAGGAYVPLDPAFPEERLAFMMEDSQLKVIVTQRSLLRCLPAHNAQAICLDSDWSTISQESGENSCREIHPDTRAYVIYTSGSTGKPKGVEISHRAVVNFLSSMREQPGMTEQDVLLAVTTISFDIAGLELFLPLIVGACVVIVSREVALDGRRLMEQLENSRATVMQATPATWQMLIDVDWSGRKDLKILCGGEVLIGELASQLLERGASLWNLYGPTESTIWSTVYRVESVDGAVPIGRPIANTEIYILDRYLKPVPVGVPGELHIGGDGLARGYLNREELTQEKFIRHPFNTDPRARLYKTGDQARYLSDGNIEFLGRIDHQVKLRGFRIELGEIESVLNQHSGVRQSLVVVREDEPGDRRLVAYIVPNQDLIPNVHELRNFLKFKLPDYMIPSVIISLDALPLTPNGKVDRRSLPAADQSRLELENSFVPPQSSVQKTLADIWAEVLKIEQIGLYDNFFDLGGHSLLATQVISRLRDALRVEMSLRLLFEQPTVAGLAERIDTLLWAGEGSRASVSDKPEAREETKL